MFFDINLYENPKILVHISGKKPQNAEQVRDVADGCMRIRGDKLGIVGLGNIGTAVALRAKAFGFEVLYYDPEIPDGKGRSLGLKKMNTLNELLHDSDCVSVHCALTRQTYNLFNEVSFSKMRQVSYEFKSRNLTFDQCSSTTLLSWRSRPTSSRIACVPGAPAATLWHIVHSCTVLCAFLFFCFTVSQDE